MDVNSVQVNTEPQGNDLQLGKLMYINYKNHAGLLSHAESRIVFFI